MNYKILYCIFFIILIGCSPSKGLKDEISDWNGVYKNKNGDSIKLEEGKMTFSNINHIFNYTVKADNLGIGILTEPCPELKGNTYYINSRLDRCYLSGKFYSTDYIYLTDISGNKIPFKKM